MEATEVKAEQVNLNDYVLVGYDGNFFYLISMEGDGEWLKIAA